MLTSIKKLLLVILIQLSFSSTLLFANDINPSKNNLSPNELFELAINHPISYYVPMINSKGNYEYVQKINEAQAKTQKDSIELAIQMGANLTNLLEIYCHYFPLEILFTHKELFLEHISPNVFIKLILKSDITSLTDPTHQIDKTLAKQQSELLQLSIKQGADLNQTLGNWITSINIENLYSNKELLLNEIGPSEFLILVVHSKIHLNAQDKALQLELAQLAIDLGADPNFKKNRLAVTLSSSFGHTMELLQLLIDHGANHTTNSNRLEEIKEAELAYVLLDPELIFKQKYKNLHANESLTPKMPYIIHHIWLTHPGSPKEIRDVDIANAIATKNIFSQAPVQWQHIVWTNDPQLFPESVMRLEQAGIQIKCIHEQQENLKLFKLIETLIDNRQWGKASDTLRVALLEYFGGVYADLNYIFNRDVTFETHTYNFFTSTYKDDYIANFFFGSSPGHPILQKTLSLIERNLLTPPTYVGSSTYLATANPIYLAYYSQANQNENIDVIYPGTSYHRKSKINPNYSDNTEYTQQPTLDSSKVNSILKTICPIANYDDYIQSREICGSESHFIGYDSPNGETWITND